MIFHGCMPDEFGDYSMVNIEKNPSFVGRWVEIRAMQG
jgi:hypothetical protein